MFETCGNFVENSDIIHGYSGLLENGEDRQNTDTLDTGLVRLIKGPLTSQGLLDDVEVGKQE